MEPQNIKAWSDVKSPASWTETVVDLVVPSGVGAAARVEHVPAKSIQFRSSGPPGLFGAIVVSDAQRKQTYVLTGGRFYISDQAGMIAGWLVLGTLNLSRSFIAVPMTASSETAAIEKLATEFTPQKIAEETSRHSSVRLAAAAPADFFVKGSQPVSAETVGFEVSDRVLRLSLRSHSGTVGTFWVDLTTQAVTKTQFGG